MIDFVILLSLGSETARFQWWAQDDTCTTVENNVYDIPYDAEVPVDACLHVDEYDVFRTMSSDVWKITCLSNNAQLQSYNTIEECNTKEEPIQNYLIQPNDCFKAEDDLRLIKVECLTAPEPKTKSKLSTGAIIGISLAVLFVVSLIILIYRSQLTTRFAKRTGEELIQ